MRVRARHDCQSLGSRRPVHMSDEQSVVADASGTTPLSSNDMSLSTLDKIKRFFFSKEEWEAYLLERLEEEKRKKGESPIITSSHLFFISNEFLVCNHLSESWKQLVLKSKTKVTNISIN